MSPAESRHEFAGALSRGREGVVSFAKADRHCHSLLSASLASISAWADRPLRPPVFPFSDFDGMRRYAHEELYAVIRTKRGFEFTAEQTLREAGEDGVRILEMSLDVDFVSFYRDTEDFLDFVRGLASRYCQKPVFRPEIGISKNRDPAGQIRPARDCIESGLFGSIDLYGNEYAREPEEYRSLYRRAAGLGMKLKAHVGEFGDAGHVERTLRTLGLHEIQHGVAAARSRQLMGILRTEGIRLNVCPSSNVGLSVCPDLAHHQIRVLVDNGVRVSINSDDRTIFGNSVSDEYLALYRAATLSAEELAAIREDSLLD